MTKISEATAHRLRALHPDIPEERLPAIVARSLVGAVLSIVGFLLMGGATMVTLKLLYEGKTPSVPGLLALAAVGVVGLFMLTVGLLTAAGRIVKQPLALALATMKGALDVWRGRNGS